MKKLRNVSRIHSIQYIPLGFLALILIGSGLLTLPFFSQSGETTPFIDALFTATSATCVTGLTTLATDLHWNFGGQAIILCLIEVGGLGFMMIPILFFSMFRMKVGLRARIVLQEALNLESLSGVMKLMLYIIRLALCIQLLGTFLLAIDFLPKYGIAQGLWLSIFHAVSAFCNAGFDLFGDSMVGFEDNPYVLMIIAGLIIAGGLGFIVWRDLLDFTKRKKFSLHSKIALTVTIGLLVVGTGLFYLTETNGNGGLTRLVDMFFLAVTPRTAGFFSIDYFKMSSAGIIVTILLMFIGGTSGSTAGGLKTTTFGVLLIQIFSMLRGRNKAEAFGRTIKPSVVFKALTMFFLALSICIVAVVILSITEELPTTAGVEYFFFEVVSAFGTVGLTMGLTPDLTVVGKLVIILLMYIGRVGILTIGLSLTIQIAKNQATGHYKLPEESVMIG
ncbi:TrkH family potassium uptake protein [Enterococcus sp. AZ103]|uniref:TrkH family potassium uptake protein n=1 Tax=Enterococcus sp. AZ103 TaxID=2774628 RepID=UPI003F2233F9